MESNDLIYLSELKRLTNLPYLHRNLWKKKGIWEIGLRSDASSAEPQQLSESLSYFIFSLLYIFFHFIPVLIFWVYIFLFLLLGNFEISIIVLFSWIIKHLMGFLGKCLNLGWWFGYIAGKGAISRVFLISNSIIQFSAS